MREREEEELREKKKEKEGEGDDEVLYEDLSLPKEIKVSTIMQMMEQLGEMAIARRLHQLQEDYYSRKINHSYFWALFWDLLAEYDSRQPI